MTAIVDNAEAIRARLQALHMRCAVRQSRPVAECWCYCQGLGGAHLPCPDAPLPPPGDPLAELREHCRRCGVAPFWHRR
jgi:hypothetical protein